MSIKECNSYYLINQTVWTFTKIIYYIESNNIHDTKCVPLDYLVVEHIFIITLFGDINANTISYKFGQTGWRK